MMLGLAGCDEEAVLLMLCDMREREKTKKTFNLSSIADEDCRLLFRFEKQYIPQLKDALHFPDNFICEQGCKVSGAEALCILPRRLAYPNRLSDISPLFGRSSSELSLQHHTRFCS